MEHPKVQRKKEFVVILKATHVVVSPHQRLTLPRPHKANNSHPPEANKGHPYKGPLLLCLNQRADYSTRHNIYLSQRLCVTLLLLSKAMSFCLQLLVEHDLQGQVQQHELHERSNTYCLGGMHGHANIELEQKCMCSSYTSSASLLNRKTSHVVFNF